jgi:putative DNA primase/helicase
MNALLDTPEILDTPETETQAATVDLKAEWLEHFTKAICPSSGLAQLAIPPREPILGEWLKEGDLGFIFSTRGLGKTWYAMYIARKIAEGGSVGEWPVHKPRRVLYVDGEMPLEGATGIRGRDAGLSTEPTDGMYYLHHEALFHFTGKVLNLTNSIVQTALLEQCQRGKFEVLILDNLSCLFTGIKENDADAWELVLPWLLELRRNRIAVIFIAHAGRNGLMRGTSRREDAAFWVIQLTESKDACKIQNGAKFVARFVKNRNAMEGDCPPLEWHFQLPKGETRAVVSWKTLSTAQIFRQWIEDGVTSATDIADEMGISKGQVSKLAKRAIMEGWLQKNGRDYALTAQA